MKKKTDGIVWNNGITNHHVPQISNQKNTPGKVNIEPGT